MKLKGRASDNGPYNHHGCHERRHDAKRLSLYQESRAERTKRQQ